jgi:hypothetical protein
MSTSPSTVLLAIAIIALGFLVVAAFYESLATRDIYVGRVMRAARRKTSKPILIGLVYAATVGVGIPILVVAWAFVLSLALILVGSLDRVASAAVVAVSVVGAARILAYAREKTAQDLAKAVPLALAFLLISGGALNLDQKFARLREDPTAGDLTPDLLLLLVALELVLRIVTDGAHAVLAAVRQRRGIDSDLRVWRTLWAAIRRPIPADRLTRGAEDRVVLAEDG